MPQRTPQAGGNGRLVHAGGEVSVVESGQVTTVRARGALVDGADALLRAVLDTALASGRPWLELDLRGVARLDSRALLVIEAACGAAIGCGRSLSVRGLAAPTIEAARQPERETPEPVPAPMLERVPVQLPRQASEGRAR